jgi:DNA mismatch endonuclease Vsr
MTQKKGYKQTEEHKINRGIYGKREKRSEQHCKRISISKKGKRMALYGKLPIIVWCEICGTMKVVKPSRIEYYNTFLCSQICKSIFYKGKKLNKSTKEKISLQSKLYWSKKENRENMSRIMTVINPFKGKKHGKQTRMMMSVKAKIIANSEIGRQQRRDVRAKQILPFKDSKPEKMMQLLLELNNIKFQKHRQDIFGYPDIFIEPNICLFIDGCWFHYCMKCYGHLKPNQQQINKLIRDSDVNHRLFVDGKQLIRVWEHDIIKNTDNCSKNIITLINSLQETLFS